MTTAKAKAFFETFSKSEITAFRMLAQSGSARINWYAEASGTPYIVTFNENLRENEAFFYFSEIFSEKLLNTPKIFETDITRRLYIQEFVGAQTLSEVIENEGESPRVKILVQKSLKHLFHLQSSTKGYVDFSKTFEYERYDHLPILHDLYYFKNFMVDILELPYHKSTLLKEFYALTTKVEGLGPKILMLRDFQSRNIMVKDFSEVYFIDYQGAMEGPAMYDVISFLHQAKANFSAEFKNEMEHYFISLYPENVRPQLEESVKFLRLMRYLQVLGAYGFRGLIQRKPHFISSISKGIANLYEFCHQWDEIKHYPELKMVAEKLASKEAREKIEKIIIAQ